MNTKPNAPASPAADARAYANVVVLLARRDDRREFGTGYGRSSGYAAAPRYVRDSGLSRFRCA